MRNADYTGKLFCGILWDDEVVEEEAMVVEVKGGLIFEFTDVWRVVDSAVQAVAKGRWTGKKYADFKSLGMREISDSLWDALVNKNRMYVVVVWSLEGNAWLLSDEDGKAFVLDTFEKAKRMADDCAARAKVITLQ